MAKKREDEPHAQRNGRLKYGNPSGDLSTAERCGARTRRGTSCAAPAMRNGRCRLHGGLSTGPRTPEGLARSRSARLVHGMYSAESRAWWKNALQLIRDVEESDQALEK